MSPLLFSLYVNDLEDHLLENNCNYINIGDAWIDNMLKILVLMYADDTVILAESEAGVRNALKAMEMYCEKWKLDINCKKTKITIFSKDRCQPENYNFQFKGEKIDVVENYKYLGVTMSYNGSFKLCQEELCQQGKRAMYSLIAKCRKFDLPIDLQLELFDAMVLPIITYGCEIWGYRTIRDLENLHITFMKHILHVRKTTCNSMVYGELGKYPISTHIKSRMLNYWSRIISGKQDKLCYIMYQCIYRLYNANSFRSPWLNCINNLLNNSGMSGIWLNQEVRNPLWLKLAFERSIKDQWITEWYADLNSKSSCSTYVSFREVFSFQSYLVNLPKHYRINLCKLRTNNHRLPIVTGRFNRTPREQRICNKCSENIVGDEFHVLLECTNQEITQLRLRCIPLYYRSNPSRLKMVQLFNDSRYKVQYKFAVFVKSVFSLFR